VSGIDESNFYQHRWHFGVLEYIEMCSAPDSSGLGEAGADKLKEFFRKDLPLITTAIVPDLKAGGLSGPWSVKVWIGIEMYGNKYVCVLRVRDVSPHREWNKNVCFSGEHRGGLLIIEDQLKFLYDCQSQLFLCERTP
jgi:hypothetical protein